jgi:hypothetical protein
MKNILTVVMACAALFAVAQDKDIALAQARAKIGEVISKPAQMTSVVKRLSAADQTAFLSEVNSAIGKMPASNEEKAAKFLDVNSAALKGAKKGNLALLLAEVFATVPPEALTVVNERFAAELFNRSANPTRTITDAQFTDIAKNLFAKVQERNAASEDAAVRNTFAILMLLRASNGTPQSLRDTLVAEMADAEARKLAQEEWISPAMGIGQDKTYDPMLGASDAGSAPSPAVVLQLANAQSMESLLSEFNAAPAAVPAKSQAEGSASLSFISVVSSTFTDPEGVGLFRVPRGYDGQTTGYRRR